MQIQKLPSLDGWRALAIILVLYSHAQLARGAKDSGLFPDELTFLGEFGVRVFFVISGFLITFLLLEEQRATGRINLRLFYLRRTLRIFPVYFLYLFILGLLAFTGLYEDYLSNWIGSLTFTRNVIGRGSGATGHLWSLAVEEQFYLVWPILLVFLGLASKPRKAALALFAMMALSLAVRVPECANDGIICLRVIGKRSLFAHADHLAAGCLAAYLLVYSKNSVPRPTLTAWSAFVLVIVAVIIEQNSSTAVRSLLRTGQAIGIATCIIATVAARPWGLFQFFNFGPLTYVGRLSYSIYIWHLLFLSGSMFEPLGSLPIYDWRVWWIPAFLAAAASYYLLEMPLARLRSQLHPK